LMGIGGLWEGVNSIARVLTTAASVGLSLLVLQGVYERRHKLREDYLLERVKASSKKKPRKIPQLKVHSKTMFVPVMTTVVVLLLACALVQSEMVWKLSEMLSIVEEEEATHTPTPTPTSTPKPGTTPEPTPTPTPTPKPTAPAPPGFPEKVERAWPLIFLSGYVGLSPALVYSSSMLLAQEYTKRMNRKLPLPIFLQDEKLAQIVRKEAEVELGRIDPKSPNMLDLTGYVEFEEETDPRILRLAPGVDVLAAAAGGGPPSPRVKMWGQAGTWTWDELERTQDGGIKMKVARQEVYQLLKQTEESASTPSPRVSYVVHADPWGRITKIERDTK